MNENPDSLWWTLALLDSAVGAGALIYGIRQKDPVPLVAGIALSIVPLLASTGLISLTLTALCIIAWLAARRLL